MSLFFNGAEVARTSFDENLLDQSTLPLRIGWMHEDETLSDSPFSGQIDEVRVWKLLAHRLKYRQQCTEA